MNFEHISVLLNETIENLEIKEDGTYLDGTLGGGGHAFHVASKLGRNGHFYGIDQDEAAIEAATDRLAEYGDKVVIIRDNYRNAKEALAKRGIFKVDGIVLDLGVSSYQLDTIERGFSYKYEDTTLDMRMDRRQTLSAKVIINEYPEMELFRMIRDYGEDKFAKNIAKHIAKAREEKMIETTGQLNEIIKAAIPAKMRVKGHPSKKTFQAIRIECNRELDVLKESLEELIELLNPGGRLCIITFHSLEDRIVKVAFRNNGNPCTCPYNFPACVCGKESTGKVITRKPIMPSLEEIEANKRSKSAKLRVFEKKS